MFTSHGEIGKENGDFFVVVVVQIALLTKLCLNLEEGKRRFEK